MRWDTSDDDPLLPHLAIVDADLAQAIQSCKEEVAAGYLESEEDIASARASLTELYGALEESKRLVDAWGGEFCFDRVCQSTHARKPHLMAIARAILQQSIGDPPSKSFLGSVSDLRPV
jgi:hypothetical protein